MARKRLSLPNYIQKSTFGTGRVSKCNDMERVGLYVDQREYNGFIDLRTRSKLLFAFPQRSVQHTGRTMNRTSKLATTPKENELSLSKTYLTKSGKMMLYSDRKVMKDKDNASEASDNDSLDIMGQSIARPKSNVSNSKWIQHVGKKTPGLASAWTSNGISCRDKDRYIKSRASYRSRWTEPAYYSGVNSSTQMRTMDPLNKSDITTVKGLSEAVLAYDQDDVTDNNTDRYLALIKKKWRDRTDVEKQQLIVAGRMCKVTDWTHDWIHVHRKYLRESTRQHMDGPARPAEEVRSRPKHTVRNSRRKSQTFAWDSGYDKYSRVPVNTPLAMVPRTFTRSSTRTENNIV